MIREPLVIVCTCEISGRVRGKGFPLRDLPGRMATGVGWIATNGMISALGPIADSPFGATHPLLLIPDPDAEFRVDFQDGTAPEHLFMGDLRHPDGTVWACCPRDFLKRGLARLRGDAGLTLLATFEHEFVHLGVPERPGSGYSLDSWRRQGVFGEVLTAALRQAGIAPDSFLPEYGVQQFEVTTGPVAGLRAADEAVMVRELVRGAALRFGHAATFTPIVEPDGVGSGVHVHFSLRDAAGRPAMQEEGGQHGLSAIAAHFIAGLLHHAPAIVALTAPSPVSFIRMRPNRWAPVSATLGEEDRAACVRICVPPTLDGRDRRGQFNVEFRAADAAASPYIALGAIVHAGADGIARKLALPNAPDAPRFPATLAEALDALSANEAAKDWLGPVFHDAYLRHKRAELRMVEGLDDAALCARYAETY